MGNDNYVFIGMGGGFGPLAQVMPIVDELNKYNLKIVCHNYHAAADMVKKLNVISFELPPILSPKKINPNGPEWWNEDYLWSKYGYLDYDYTKCLIEIFTEAITRLKSKVLISLHFPAIAVVARILAIPLVCITQACTHKHGKGGRTTWWKELPENLDRVSPVINRILSEHGLKPIERMEDLNEGDITIVPSIPEFDVIETENVFYTGPMLWEGPREILDVDFKIKKNNKYLIHAYTGHLFNSSGKDTGIILLKNIVKAFNHTEFDVIISTGTGQKVPKDIQVAENITISEWLPINILIPDCDLIIHHGGHGYSLQGLAHGVPSIILPTTDEREYNARQLLDLGVGLFIPPIDMMTPEVLLMKSREIVSNAQIRENSRNWSRIIKQRNYNGASQAARMILDLVKQ